MISFVCSEALGVKVVLLISLEELQAVGDFWIHVPSFLPGLKTRLLLVVDPGKHPCLEEASCPVEIPYVQFDSCAPQQAFCQDAKVEPVHQSL